MSLPNKKHPATDVFLCLLLLCDIAIFSALI